VAIAFRHQQPSEKCFARKKPEQRKKKKWNGNASDTLRHEMMHKTVY